MQSNGQTVGYFHDGYTVDGYIDGVDRLYPAVRFRFRPMLTQNRAVIDNQISLSRDPRKTESIAAQVICAQLEAWDLVKPDGETIKLTVSEVLRIPPALMNRLYRVVMGMDPPDEDPDVPDAQRDDNADEAVTAALAGQTPEDAAAKNS